ncbi:MAG TPA: dolichyl-phosphate beta-glucosyltransferase [Candidatus Acidoferrales bacterium]|nr:dolichyl-phosphate beta-glucosyltransferase [Candidatus Acidoferrales bacterium]
MKISVVLPAYNEALRILPSLERIFVYMRESHPDFEVIVVDDGSGDNTSEAIRQRFGDRPELQVQRYEKNRGKGHAVRYGASRANGDLVLFSDADLSTPIEDLDKMLPLMQQGYDLVIGSRAHAQSEIRQHQHFLREAAGKFFNVCVRLLVGLPFHDTQCGFKIFRRNSMRPVLEQLQIDRFAFDVELVALALAMGLKVGDVPVVWSNSPASTVSFWSGLEAYTELFAIRRRARRIRAERTRGRLERSGI